MQTFRDGPRRRYKPVDRRKGDRRKQALPIGLIFVAMLIGELTASVFWYCREQSEFAEHVRIENDMYRSYCGNDGSLCK